MALELENINNLVTDDLDLRNRNWTAIDDSLELKADKGDIVSLDNLNSQHIEDALGFTPISADDVPEGLILGEGPIEKGWLFKPVTIVDERNE